MASSVEGNQVGQSLQLLQNSGEQTDQPAVCGYSNCCAAAQGMSRHAQLVSSSNCQNTQNSSVLAATLPCLQGLQWTYAQLALDLLEHRKKAEAKQHKVQWRGGGSKVRGEVNERLTIIYAILRQIYETHSSEGT